MNIEEITQNHIWEFGLFGGFSTHLAKVLIDAKKTEPLQPLTSNLPASCKVSQFVYLKPNILVTFPPFPRIFRGGFVASSVKPLMGSPFLLSWAAIFHGQDALWQTNIAGWKSPPFLIGDTSSNGGFPIAMLV